MATGGVFQILSNEGCQEKLLTAKDYLDARVAAIEKKIEDNDIGLHVFDKSFAPCNAGQKSYSASWQPYVNEIEKSHVMHVNGSYKPFVIMAYEYTKTPCQTGQTEFGSTVEFTFNKKATFINDVVIHLRLTGLKAINPVDKVRYVSFPGHRVFDNLKMSVNGNILDEYGPEEYNAHYNFKVPPSKRTGWLRNIGQEIPTQGFVTNDPLVDETREYRWFGDGPQTFKAEHGVVDLWIPLLFWFTNIKTALPTSALANASQCKVICKLTKLDNLISVANYSGGTSTTLSDYYEGPTISKCDIYTNNIFMEPWLQDIFHKKFGMTLIRIHKKQIVRGVRSQEGRRLIQGIKFPVETMYIGFQPTANLGMSQYWHKNARLTQTNIPVPVSSATVVSINQVALQQESPSIDSMKLEAHGITVWDEAPPEFFNAYIPYRYGATLNTPEDSGWYMFNFCFTPGDHNPSGYLHTSKTREFYINWTSGVSRSIEIDAANEVNIIVLADCINFLVTADNSAVLAYST